MTDDIAIKVDHVSKDFKLPRDKNTSLKSAFINFFRSNKKGYDIQHALKDVSFEVKKGEFFGIVGRNGSGKSTLLKLIAGIYTPDSGDINVSGKLMPFIELGVGFSPALTGRDNIYLNGALLGFSRKDMDNMYDDIVEFAELQNFMDQKLKNYSSGMQVRLAFSIAIRAQSDILILDEVLAVGDDNFQQKCLGVFREYKKQHRTIVLVTHSMEYIERFCDRALVIQDGISLGALSTRKAVSTYRKINIEDEGDNDDQVSPDKKVSRKVSHELKIKNVKVFSLGVSTSTVNVGDSCYINIDITNNTGIEGFPFTVGLALYDEDGVNLAGPNSLKEKFLSGKSHTRVRFTINNMILTSRKIYVTTALFDEFADKTYDYIEDSAHFSVISSDMVHGKIVLDGIWQQN